MNQVIVKKADLLTVIEANREKHRHVFLEAQGNYRRMAIEELERTLEDARRGKRFNRILTLEAPQDMTKHYDRVIGMLKAHTEPTIEVTAIEYRNYVQDDWNWSQTWANNTRQYASHPDTEAYLTSKMGGEEV